MVAALVASRGSSPQRVLSAVIYVLRLYVGTIFPVPLDANFVFRYASNPAFRQRKSVAVAAIRFLRLVVFGPILLRNFFSMRRQAGPSFLREIFFPIGVESIFQFHRLHDWILSMSLRYGRTVTIIPGWIFPVIFTSDPECVRHILNDNFDNYTKKSVILSVTKDLLGDGIFIADHGSQTSVDQGKSWRMQRKVAAQIFTMNNFRGFMEQTFVKHGREVCNIMDATRGDCFDLQTLFFKAALDSIGVLGFGIELSTLKQSKQDVPFVTAFDTVQRIAMDRLVSVPNQMCMVMLPQTWYPGIMRYFRPFVGSERQMGLSLAQLDDFALDVIRKRRRRLQAEVGQSSPSTRPRARSASSPKSGASEMGIGEWNDFLSLFMNSDINGGEELSDQFLRDIVMSFFIAGRDTTASTLSWLFLLLGQDLAAQAEVQRELDENLNGRQPTFDDIRRESDMPMLNAVVWETLRLFPPVAGDPKAAARSDRLPDGTFVPAGAEVIYMPYVMGRDPSVWPEAGAFRPSRWIPFKRPSPFAMPVFQAGPRICLGMEMALFEVKITAAMLLQEFIVRLEDPDRTWEYQVGPTICPKGGLPVRVERRRARTTT